MDPKDSFLRRFQPLDQLNKIRTTQFQPYNDKTFGCLLYDESEEDTGDEGLGRQDGGRDFLRQQFVKTVYQSFLQGKDDGFDYRKVDNDESLDDLDAEQRDAEERYFEDSDIDE